MVLARPLLLSLLPLTCERVIHVPIEAGRDEDQVGVEAGDGGLDEGPCGTEPLGGHVAWEEEKGGGGERGEGQSILILKLLPLPQASRLCLHWV